MVHHDLGIPIIEEVDLDKDMNKIKRMVQEQGVKRLGILVGKGNRFGEILYCTNSRKDFEKKKTIELKTLPKEFIKTKAEEDNGFFGVILEKALSPSEVKKLKS